MEIPSCSTQLELLLQFARRLALKADFNAASNYNYRCVEAQRVAKQAVNFSPDGLAASKPWVQETGRALWQDLSRLVIITPDGFGEQPPEQLASNVAELQRRVRRALELARKLDSMMLAEHAAYLGLDQGDPGEPKLTQEQYEQLSSGQLVYVLSEAGLLKGNSEFWELTRSAAGLPLPGFAETHRAYAEGPEAVAKVNETMRTAAMRLWPWAQVKGLVSKIAIPKTMADEIAEEAK